MMLAKINKNKSKSIKSKKSKIGFMDRYKTYDTSQGFGSPDEWRGGFEHRMGFAEAKTIVGDNSPQSILGISLGATVSEIKTAFRKLIMQWHPDKHQSEEDKKFATEMTKKIVAAYTVLTNK